ncbi:hypothetical protein ICE98_03300 [Lactococcus lactis]|nr:hypothetical protein [Lactococcus lactis]MDM5146163.1 hypothetical protein [Lactococcus lactis]
MTAEKRFGNQYPTQSVILPFTETKYQEALRFTKNLNMSVIHGKRTF